MTVHSSNHSTQEAEAERSLWVWGQPGLQSEFQDSQGYTEKLSQKTRQNKMSNKQNNNKTPNKNNNLHQKNKLKPKVWLWFPKEWDGTILCFSAFDLVVTLIFSKPTFFSPKTGFLCVALAVLELTL